MGEAEGVRAIPGWAWPAGVAGSLILVVLLCLGVTLGPGLWKAIPAPTEVPTLRPTEGIPPANASLGDTWPRPADGMVMVYVPAGEFEMGSDSDDVDDALQICKERYSNCEREWFEREQPAHTVALDGFWIDRTEVTNAQYRQCVEAGACDASAESSSYARDSYYGNGSYDDYPVIYVSWYQATAYCEWAEARLPTEAEWEYAARGPEARVYPWGDEWDKNRLSSSEAGPGDMTEVGSYPGGASWCGALDMAGNVWEWVADWYNEDYYGSSPSQNPTGPPSGTYRVLRGGSSYDRRFRVRSAFRFRDLPVARRNYVGFRCCVSPASSP